MAILFTFQTVYAQKNIVRFFNQDLEEIEHKSEAFYIQNTTFSEDGYYNHQLLYATTDSVYATFTSIDQLGKDKVGLYTVFHQNGKKKHQGHYKKFSTGCKKYGIWESWYKDGSPKMTVKRSSSSTIKMLDYWDEERKHSVIEGYGKYIEKWEGTDQIKLKGKYERYHKTGRWTSYAKNGKLLYEEVWEKNKITEGKSWDKDNHEYTYNKKPISKAHPLSRMGFSNLIKNSIKYPQLAYEQKIEGTVDIRFYVDLDSTISEITVKQSSNSVFEQEALRVFTKYAYLKWAPKTIRGKAVADYTQYKVRFKMSSRFSEQMTQLDTEFYLTEKLKHTNYPEMAKYIKVISQKGQRFEHKIFYKEPKKIYCQFYAEDISGVRKKGVYQTFYTNGKVMSKGEYLKGFKFGKWEDFNEKGQKIREIIYENAEYRATGKMKEWYNNGNLAKEGDFVDGGDREMGDWKYYYPNGKLFMEVRYNSPELSSVKHYGDKGTMHYYSTKRNSKNHFYKIGNAKKDNFQWLISMLAKDVTILNFYDKDGKQTIKDGYGIFNLYDAETNTRVAGAMGKKVRDINWLFIGDDSPSIDKEVAYGYRYFDNIDSLKFIQNTYGPDANFSYISSNKSSIKILDLYDSNDTTEIDYSNFWNMFFTPIIHLAVLKEVLLHPQYNYLDKAGMKTVNNYLGFVIKYDPINKDYKVRLYTPKGGQLYKKAFEDIHSPKNKKVFQNLMDGMMTKYPELVEFFKSGNEAELGFRIFDAI
ncbi:hypothetical protein AVL50_12290 [Flammeovirga sp. SJP92]|nr:hypothetical protein AVL50_12290 [Flammeovirga sp. SJP92]